MSPCRGMIWQTTRFDLDLTRPRVMGIVNLTPDSFSDGGRLARLEDALAHARQLLEEGADILDVGGESTRPGAASVSAEEEWQRLHPFLSEAIRWQVPLSVDTRRTVVMERALDLGVDIINDIHALQDTGAESLLAAHGRAGICLMHMQGEPGTMQQQPMAADAHDKVLAFLKERAAALLDLGVDARRMVLDPGIGFGKSVALNFELLARTSELCCLGYPVLAGWSRKSSLAAVTSRAGEVPAPEERLAASLAAAVLSVERGARVVRVHDVRETVQALQVWQAMSQGPA